MKIYKQQLGHLLYPNFKYNCDVGWSNRLEIRPTTKELIMYMIV